ncbi:MAG: pyridoxamine kinase [Ruminococcaceae bacterium]|nr:pyridoxamine kinase [Oscillospiraceae bacterium]
MKNILAIHDLSCFGRCALTVVIPTLSAMTHQVTPLPTALLSTHTGGFEGMNFIDLSDTMRINFDHMKSSGADFDTVYSGFLGSAKQIDTVAEIIKKSKNAFICVDPVMGDDGKLYQTYTEEMKERMSELCHLADLITPNLTEAAFLLGEDFLDTLCMSKKEAVDFAKELCGRLYEKFKNPYIAVTGIKYKDGDREFIGTAVMHECGFDFIIRDHVCASYPGTGDIFASALIGSMLRGKSFSDSADFASGFIRELVEDTYAAGTPVRNGVLLEKNLYRLITH